ncbi:hypothetical protein Taro_029376 [Colocasia esculenta]|uniref:LOB domain-containing protein n=1 Tax=Colocasia esculenta TaxID=4460 RepID=A0A843VL78_COLES|nr:hypothetical protein [Colocasia esculenta]
MAVPKTIHAEHGMGDRDGPSGLDPAAALVVSLLISTSTSGQLLLPLILLPIHLSEAPWSRQSCALKGGGCSDHGRVRRRRVGERGAARAERERREEAGEGTVGRKQRLWCGKLIRMKEVSRKQGSTSPCAACKLLRRRCAHDCIFAPYFPAEEPQKFANVHKVFGASNVSKMLQELPEHHRCDAVSSMVYEANARLRDPVYGCVGAISSLQHQIDVLQSQLAVAQAEMVRLRLWQKVYIAAAAATSGDAGGGGVVAAAAGAAPAGHPSKLAAAEPHPKTLFSMDMAVDQVLAMDEPMWSC